MRSTSFLSIPHTGTEYSFLDVLNKTMTPDEQRSPDTQEMSEYAATIAGLNKLNITPVGGGQ